MSYSFSARGTTKAETIKNVSFELDKVVAAQPVHAADRAQAQAAAQAFLGVLPENVDGYDFYVSVSGSVGWKGSLSAADQVLTSAGVNVSASLIAKGT
jgi:hypothetical protein